MFCPNCGQQQVSDNTKFCPRCGTQLAGLADWLAGGGVNFAVRETPAPPAPAAPLTPRRKGMRRGAKVMFLAGFLLPFLIAFSAAIEEGAPVALSFILFFIGLSMVLYARLFSDDTPRAVAGRQAPQQLPGSAVTAPVLPPATADTRLNNFGRRGVRTAEISPPPSVTENTTRLLDDE
jgi:zinc-ribbon domain